MSIIIFLILSIFLTNSDWGKKGQIEVSLIDSRTNERPMLLNYEDAQIISETGEIFSLFISKKGIFSEKLDEGNYELVFTSLFERRELEKFHISKGEKKKITIYVNKFTSDIEPIKEITMLDSILVGEEYQITFESSGCAHFFKDSITITRQKTGYYLDCEQKKSKLSNAQIAVIRDFEMKLWNNNLLAGCTTLDSYGIKYREEHLLLTLDGSCNWRGFTYIKKKIENEMCE
jgi:hypothetical protein